MAKMMRAVQYCKYRGGPSALEDVEVAVPTPKEGAMLVKVQACSVNPVDWRIQDGLLRPFLPKKFPYIPGIDVSGEVVSAGPGVVAFAPGDQILTCLDLRTGGGFAEFVEVPVKSAVKRPPSITAVEAASLPVAAMTALQSAINLVGLKLDGTGPKFNILITAASGGVGLFWTQIAKLAGCFVTATCGARNVELVRRLGADEVVNYKTPEGAFYLSPSGKKYDVVVHLAPFQPLKAFKAQLAERGRVIDMTPTLKTLLCKWYNKLTLSKHSFLPFVLDASQTSLQMATDLTADFKLEVVVDSAFPLSQAADAWARSIQGHSTGKIVLVMGS